MNPNPAKPRVLVAGWQPPPFNGRVHEVVSLLRPPFSDRFALVPYDTRMRDRRGGSRPDVALLRSAVAQIAGVAPTMRKERPDLIVFFVGPGAAFWRDLLLFRAFRQSGTPVVLRLIGGSFTEMLSALPGSVRPAVLAELRHARVVLTETQTMVEDLRRLAPGVPAFRVPNFVHLAEFPAPDPARRPDGPFRVLYFGNMTPAKGVETVLGSVDAVCARHPGTEFHFIGGELERNYLDLFRARASALRCGAAVHVHGRLPREAVHRMATGADLFAFPTRWPGEGQPAALIEAMALGLVPVASRWRGVAEIVRDGQNGLLMEEGQPDSLAEAIIRLLGDVSLRTALSRAARETIAAGYDAGPALDQFLRIVECALK